MENKRYSNIRLLNPKNLSIYNSLISAIVYIRRIITFTNIYKLRKIFATLFLYIEGKVLN